MAGFVLLAFIFSTAVQCNGECMIDSRMIRHFYTTAIRVSTDIHLPDFQDQYRIVSEDVGSVFINISSSTAEEREAYIFFTDNITYIFSLYDS